MQASKLNIPIADLALTTANTSSMQIHMSLKRSSVQAVETSVIVNSNSSFQNYNVDRYTDQRGEKTKTII